MTYIIYHIIYATKQVFVERTLVAVAISDQLVLFAHVYHMVS